MGADLAAAALEEASHGHGGADGGERDVVNDLHLAAHLLHRSHKALHDTAQHRVTR